MSEYSTVFGIDSHARTTTVCAIVVETGETATRTFPGVSPYAEIASWMSSFPGPRMGWYEAGCTGFTPARMLSGGDTRVAPIATHSMPTSPEARARKTDRTDAARLARAGLAGQLFVSSSGFQLRKRFFSHVAKKSFRFGKGVPLSDFAS